MDFTQTSYMDRGLGDTLMSNTLKRGFISGRAFSLLLSLVLLLPVDTIAVPQLPPLNTKPTGEQFNGKFIWFDLATSDLNGEKKFYSEVFGWQFKQLGDTADQYNLISNGDQNIAGMFQVDDPKKESSSSLWIGLMSVDNPQQAATYVQQNGGAVHMPPASVAQRGTFALFRDPEGALFGVLKSDSGDKPDQLPGMGNFFWMDLFARDQQKASQFYKNLAGYDVTEKEVGNGTMRLVLKTHDRARAGIVPLPEDINRAGWLPYVRVADVNETLAKAIDNGARVLVAPQEDLLDGNLAIFADPHGGVMGIVKWDDSSIGTE